MSQTCGSRHQVILDVVTTTTARGRRRTTWRGLDGGCCSTGRIPGVRRAHGGSGQLLAPAAASRMACGAQVPGHACSDRCGLAAVWRGRDVGRREPAIGGIRWPVKAMRADGRRGRGLPFGNFDAGGGTAFTDCVRTCRCHGGVSGEFASQLTGWTSMGRRSATPRQHQLRHRSRRVHRRTWFLLRAQAKRGQRRGQLRRHRRQPLHQPVGSRVRTDDRRARQIRTVCAGTYWPR